MLATYVWNKWNTLNKRLQHASETLATYATSQSTFTTSIWNTSNIPLKHLKHTFATCTFNATSPYYMGMEARRRVEFIIIVKLAGGAELAAPMEKAVAGPVEKAAAGPRTGQGRDGREAWWRGRKTGYRALVQRRYHPAERRLDGEGGVVESVVTEVARRAVQRCGEVIFFFFLRTVGGEWMRR
jgi:hypothetical protein